MHLRTVSLRLSIQLPEPLVYTLPNQVQEEGTNFWAAQSYKSLRVCSRWAQVIFLGQVPAPEHVSVVVSISCCEWRASSVEQVSLRAGGPISSIKANVLKLPVEDFPPKTLQ